MPRALFEKTGDAIFISHLDLMRLFQRAFKRAGLKLTHSQGFNPRPSVSIALPLSVGVESECELLDFDLYGDTVPMEEIRDRLNAALVAGVRVKEVYEDGCKIYFTDGSWVICRFSGTEPLLRIAAEGNTNHQAKNYIQLWRDKLSL